ncbi:MAG: hypothetical protein CMJ78_10965 [Planctomycetaceae bacterium]|nr:hypothetical protein [Planctomycetaceae bacterium]
MASLRNFGLPLLAKELREQSGRPKTYALRVLYCVLVFSFFYFSIADTLQQNSLSLANLGVGRTVVETLFLWQVAANLAFLPALTGAAIANERERGTLELIRVTRLTAWGIVNEKLLSRLLPFAILQMVSIPIMAIGYAHGWSFRC